MVERRITDEVAAAIFARGCEHPLGCPITDRAQLTIDHFTPKCVAKTLGWTTEQLNSPENLQALCVPHHIEKDATTPQRNDLLHRQLAGEVILFRAHQKLIPRRL